MQNQQPLSTQPQPKMQLLVSQPEMQARQAAGLTGNEGTSLLC